MVAERPDFSAMSDEELVAYGRRMAGLVEEAWTVYCQTALAVSLGPGAVQAICDAVGFGYKYVPSAGDYSHPSASIVLSPDGTVSNYLYGIHYPEDQLKLALQEAGDGKIGSLYDKVLFRCFLYDPNANSYVADAMLLMRISAVLTVALLGGGIGLLAWQSRRKARRADTLDPNTPPVGAAAAHA